MVDDYLFHSLNQCSFQLLGYLSILKCSCCQLMSLVISKSPSKINMSEDGNMSNELCSSSLNFSFTLGGSAFAVRGIDRDHCNEVLDLALDPPGCL